MLCGGSEAINGRLDSLVVPRILSSRTFKLGLNTLIETLRGGSESINGGWDGLVLPRVTASAI